MNVSAFMLALIGLCNAIVVADSPKAQPKLPSDRQLADIIDTLDDLSFEEREKSEKKLKALGPEILPQLNKIFQKRSKLSTESKFRVRRIIRSLEKQKQTYLVSSLDEKSITEEELKKIPGWNPFSKAFGDTAEQRKFFLKLYRAEPEVWYAYSESTRDELREVIDSRCFELQYGLLTGKRYNAPPISTLSLLFAECRPDLQNAAVAQFGNIGSIYSMAYSKSMRDAVAVESDTAKLYKKMISHWIENGETTPDYNRLYLSLRYKLPAGRKPAIRLIQQNPGGRNVQTAIFALAKFGNVEDTKLLLPLLKNKKVLSPTRTITTGKPVFTVQVRDVALVGLLVLHKQDPKSFGFTKLRSNSIYLYSTNSAGFMNDTEREKAFQKWNDWAKTNLKSVNSAEPDESET